MSRRNNSFEKGELDGLSLTEKMLAYGLGKTHIPNPAGRGGVIYFNIETAQIAENFMRGPHTGKQRRIAKAMLVALMEEAAQTNDGTKLRLLANWVEERKYSKEHDPLRFVLLMMICGDESDKSPKTAEQIQDLLQEKYPPGKMPTLKNIREVAAKIGVTLLKAKVGAPKGVSRKPVHRAKR
jgi:hypothetical protein